MLLTFRLNHRKPCLGKNHQESAKKIQNHSPRILSQSPKMKTANPNKKTGNHVAAKPGGSRAPSEMQTLICLAPSSIATACNLHIKSSPFPKCEKPNFPGLKVASLTKTCYPYGLELRHVARIRRNHLRLETLPQTHNPFLHPLFESVLLAYDCFGPAECHHSWHCGGQLPKEVNISKKSSQFQWRNVHRQCYLY